MNKKKIKERIKPYYYALKSTYLYRFFNTLNNLLFRHNNLCVALFIAKLKSNKITLGRNVVIKHCRFEIHGSKNTIIIGDDCALYGLRIYTNSDNNKLVIGKRTKVNASKKQRTLFNPCDGSEIIIGNDCLFSNNIEIHTTDYHKIMVNGIRKNTAQSVIIRDHCWIGLQSLILKGTFLAENVIIGAKSLVNKRFEEPNSVIAGNPARIIKGGVEWEP